MHGYKWPINCTRTRTALVGRVIRAVKAPALKLQADEKSKRCGNLKKGEEVTVLEALVMPDSGVTRLRCEQGWLSLKSKRGDPVVEAVDDDDGVDAGTASNGSPEEQQPPGTAGEQPPKLDIHVRVRFHIIRNARI